jgi:hypothetical protein
MEASMTADRVAADSKISEAQRLLTIGDYARSESKGITIIGEILSSDAEDAEDAEDAAEHEAWSRSFVFGRWYSKLCPQGELGDKHRSVTTKITKEEFEKEVVKLSAPSIPYYAVILGAGIPSPGASISARIMSTLRLQQTIAPLSSSAEILARKHFPQECLDRWLERQRSCADAWCIPIRISSDDEDALCADESVWLFTALNS